MSVTSPSSANVVPFQPKQAAERFVKLRHSLLGSTIWQSLGAAEQALYVNIASRYTGFNNGAIPYSVRDAKEVLHVGQTTAYRAFRGLQDRGLIVCRKPGDRARAGVWELTEFSCTHLVDHV